MSYDWQWEVVWRYHEALLKGLIVTLELNVIVIVFSTLVGLLVALLRLSKFRITRIISRTYVDLFRTLPLMVLIFWLYFAFPLFVERRITLDGFVAAVIALVLNTSAFISEIFRAGIEGVQKEHIEAGKTLGLKKQALFRYITLPILLRTMIPPLTGQYINAIKLSVLASFIAVPELLHTVQTITSDISLPLEFYTVLAVIFLIILYPATLWQVRLERRAKGKSQKPALLAENRISIDKGRTKCAMPRITGVKSLGKLKVANLFQSYNGLEVLHGIDLEVMPGEVVSIMGPNGSGKTTLSKAIAGLIPIRSGSVTLSGVRLVTPERNLLHNGKPYIIYVSQQAEPWPHLSVLENLTLPLRKVKNFPKSRAESIAKEWLEFVDLSDKSHYYSNQLSGGQRQRVILARALCMEPDVIVLDEVTSALDPEWVLNVKSIIKTLAESHVIIINVSHRISLVREISTEVCFMNCGKINEKGTPDVLFEKPQTEELKLFLSSV